MKKSPKELPVMNILFWNETPRRCLRFVGKSPVNFHSVSPTTNISVEEKKVPIPGCTLPVVPPVTKRT